MNRNVLAATIVAVALIAASVLLGGIYEFRSGSEGAAFVWRVNRFTGTMAICSAVAPEDKSDTFAPICVDVSVKKSN